MKQCIIFSGGSVSGRETLPNICDDTLIISADAGYLNALKFNILPNVCIGDFDTLKTNIDSSCKVIKYPPEKDDTDTLICIKQAISMGCNVIYIYGATGGRFDHTIANVQALEYMLNYNVTGYLVDTQNIITMQGISVREYPKKDGFNYFSIFSTSENAVISSNGLKYSLDNTLLSRSFPLGVSNEILQDTCTLTVHDGLILVSYSKD